MAKLRTELRTELRIGRLLSKLGICSRREAARFIQENDIVIEGRRITEFNEYFNESVEVIVNGKAHQVNHRNEIILLNKPVSYVCSHKEQRSQKSIFRLLPKEMKNYFYAGRLDKESEGLVVISNDGDLIYKLTHPSMRTEKVYQVKINRPIAEHEREKMLKGIFDKKEKLGFAKLSSLKNDPTMWMVHLFEGKNREIRRVFSHFNMKIIRLIRLSMGEYKLSDIPEGKTYCTIDGA